MCNSYKGITEGNTEGLKLLETAFVETLRQVFNKNSNSINFIKNLSDAEKKALSAIMDKIDDQGVISINKLCAEVDISRQVFNSLLLKMYNTKVALVSNWGARGTFIKIMDYRLLDFNT